MAKRGGLGAGLYGRIYAQRVSGLLFNCLLDGSCGVWIGSYVALIPLCPNREAKLSVITLSTRNGIAYMIPLRGVL